MNVIERSILGRLSADARKEYGDRLRGLYVFDYLFDERGRDDAGESAEDDGEASVDLDVAVVLADGDWSILDEKRLIALTFNILLETDVSIRAWPLPASAWHDQSWSVPKRERSQVEAFHVS